MEQIPSTPNSGDSKEKAIDDLCRECGLCCNGVLFHLVRLQSSDLLSELAGLGLKIKRKKGQDQFSQPCPAYQGCQCSIYHQRPTRCRLFECKQLKGVIAGEISEEKAHLQISDVQARVKRVETFLSRLGKTDLSRPLTKRYEKVTAEPADLLDPHQREERVLLEKEMQELQDILDRDFRV
ncbi:MAG: YkgJ family cysteine cluster protein [Verrucomicrobiota bacterium]